MTQQFEKPILRRNDRCACGSGKKFKHCHGKPANSVLRKTGYIDTGELPIRWVITDGRGTSFFSTKDNEILVFKSRADAYAVATMSIFQDQEPGDINVAGVGETKWQHLQSKLPFIEIDDVDQAVKFIQARIDAYYQAQGITPPAQQSPEPQPEAPQE